MEMKITDVRVVLLKKDGPIKAFAELTFNEVLKIPSFKVMKTNGDLWIGLPSKKIQDKWENTIFFADIPKNAKLESSPLYQYIKNTIIDAYNNLNKPVNGSGKQEETVLEDLGSIEDADEAGW